MMQTRLLAAAIAGALLSWGGLAAHADNEDDHVARGQEIFAEFCQGCHGENKSGLLNFSRTRDELQLILEGETDQMPDFYGIFSAAEVDAIFAYLAAPAAP
jgi:mono/diheme cytochrome c family protein